MLAAPDSSSLGRNTLGRGTAGTRIDTVQHKSAQQMFGDPLRCDQSLFARVGGRVQITEHQPRSDGRMR